jgi:hypothetical protein
MAHKLFFNMIAQISKYSNEQILAAAAGLLTSHQANRLTKAASQMLPIALTSPNSGYNYDRNSSSPCSHPHSAWFEESVIREIELLSQLESLYGTRELNFASFHFFKRTKQCKTKAKSQRC